MLWKKEEKTVALDRELYERLERYAQDHDLSVEDGLKALLEESLRSWEAEKEKLELYCPDCHILVRDTRCPRCGRKWLDAPAWSDHCYLTEQEGLWAGVLEDCLKQNAVPYVTQNVLGAGITSKVGVALERKRFFVRYDCYEKAQALLEELFSGEEEAQ